MFQPLFRRASQDTLLDGVEQIVDGGFCFAELLLIEWHVYVIPVLQIHEHGHDGLDCCIVHDHLHGLADHQILDPVLPDRLLVALGTLLFDRNALVVVMDYACPACPTLAAEVGSTVAAEQFGGQQIIVLGFVTGRGFLILCQLALHPGKEVLWNDGWDTVRHDHITILELADIAPVMEHMPHAVEGHLLTASVGKALLVEPVHNGGDGLAAVITLEGFQNKRRGQWVDLKVLLRINHITDGQRTTVELAFERIVCHTANDLLGKISRVVFCVALQNGFEDDALCALGNNFGS